MLLLVVYRELLQQWHRIQLIYVKRNYKQKILHIDHHSMSFVMLLHSMESKDFGLEQYQLLFEQVEYRKYLCFNCILIDDSIISSAALTTTQCVTYDHAKRFWESMTGWGEGIKLHLGASLITGFVFK